MVDLAGGHLQWSFQERPHFPAIWRDLTLEGIMGYFFEFDAVNNVLRVTCEGRMTDAMVREGYSAAARFQASRPPCRAIDDLSGVTTFDVSIEAVRDLATKQPAIELMVVIVAPEDLIYGMARMFTMLSEQNCPNRRVVRTMEEAYSLLGIDSPEFTRLSID